MTVRAKFFINSVELFSSPPGSGTVKLVASNTKEGDNKDWSQWTPAGSIQMTVTNPEAFKVFMDHFHSKQGFYVDFNPIEP